MNKLTAALAQSLLVAAFFAVPSFAADDEALKKDLTAVIALHGLPCGQVVAVKVHGRERLRRVVQGRQQVSRPHECRRAGGRREAEVGSNCPLTPSPPSPWSSRHHDRADEHGPASGSDVRRRAASDPPTEHVPIFLAGNQPVERADSRQHLSRRHSCQHRRCGIGARQLSRRGRALVRAPRTGGRAHAGHVALLLERSARSDAGRDRSSGLLLPFPRCHDRPARVAF